MAKMKGPCNFSSCTGDKGIPKGSKPKVSEKKGTIQFSGQAGDKGIPPKAAGKGKSSQWAGKHD
jgi:hypothetical protein